MGLGFSKRRRPEQDVCLATGALCCLGTLQSSHLQEGFHEMWPLDLKFPSLQNCEPNEPLFFMNYAV
jgi:hypothetical protein